MLVFDVGRMLAAALVAACTNHLKPISPPSRQGANAKAHYHLRYLSILTQR
jgi:hypothetical protein